MFYPADSLKRGGRFYLCWVADSWPLRFAAITHRQLWSQDIRKLCDDLLKVVTEESGRPSHRFSLRLSSQLLRGLVRLYDKKVSLFLGDLCMIHANVFKNANKKFHIRSVVVDIVERPRQQPSLTIQELPDHEPRVEEMIQNSGNVVANIQDITLKESVIPNYQPLNDGFGEEHPEQALQVFDRTLELMMVQPDMSAAHHSALEPPDVSADKSHDRSRLAPHDALVMERISEHDATMFRKSTGEELMLENFAKDIPEIPEFPLPEMPAPEPEKEVAELEETMPPEPTKDVLEPMKDVLEPAEKQTRHESVEIELEAIQDQPPARKRRYKPRLIMDKKIKISAPVLRARIDNPTVDLRCEHSFQDIIDLRVPWDMYAKRPAHAGSRLVCRMAISIAYLFERNLGVVGKRPLADVEMEEVLVEKRRPRTRSTAEKTIEIEDPQDMPQGQIKPPTAGDEVDIIRCQLETEGITNRGQDPPVDISRLDLELPVDLQTDVSKEPRVSVQELMDISDLPTQKLKRLSQQSQHKASGGNLSPPKRPRLSGYLSFKECQQLPKEIPEPVYYDQDKENVPPGVHQQSLEKHDVRRLSAMLQEAGLSDIQPLRHEVDPEPTRAAWGTQRARNGSESSETQLGSIDRTKVSLGDSVNTTDSQKFIRNHWGIEGTMVKIVSNIKAGLRPVTVETLVAKGPVLVDCKRLIAARCFSSILKLKQHGFITIIKDPDSLAIQDIALGPRFDSLQ